MGRNISQKRTSFFWVKKTINVDALVNKNLKISFYIYFDKTRNTLKLAGTKHNKHDLWEKQDYETPKS